MKKKKLPVETGNEVTANLSQPVQLSDVIIM